MEFLAPLACVWLLIFYLKFKHFSIIPCTLYIYVYVRSASVAVCIIFQWFFFFIHIIPLFYIVDYKNVYARKILFVRGSKNTAVCVCTVRGVFSSFVCTIYTFCLYWVVVDALCFYVRDAFRVFTVYIHTTCKR